MAGEIASARDGDRSEKLSKYFELVIRGKRDLKTITDGDRFIEAICDEPDATNRIEAIIAADKGLDACRKVVRLSLELSFLLGAATKFLTYLSAPSLRHLASGHFLYRILEAIVEPPSFWNALVDAHEKRLLSDQASHAFGWLLLEILCSQYRRLPDVRLLAEKITQDSSLISSSAIEVRTLGQRIKHMLNTTSTDLNEDFRNIKILPTGDEFASTERPFYRTAEMVASSDTTIRGAVHIDNHFRLLRENLLGELRNDVQIATGKKKGSRRNFITPNLDIKGIDCGSDKRRKPCCLTLTCQNDFPQLFGMRKKQDRERYVQRNKSFMKHQSFGCLLSEGTVLAFASVDRDEVLLAQSPPIIVLQIDDHESFSKVLLASKTSSHLTFAQVDTAVFAYKPVLKALQMIRELPLQEQLVDLQPDSNKVQAGILPHTLIQRILQECKDDLSHLFASSKPIHLDDRQAEALVNALAKKVGLIQGPPGTGKSFIGALTAKAILEYSSETIMVLCYTNHALDQFLDDLSGVGISRSGMVRLGSKGDPRNDDLKLVNQKSTYKHNRSMWRVINDLEAVAQGYFDVLRRRISKLKRFQASHKEVLEYLEFSDESEFYDAFTVPENADGMTTVGRRGRAVNPHYLIDRWTSGLDPGFFREMAHREHPGVWNIDRATRRTMCRRWARNLMQEETTEIGAVFHKYNKCQEELQQLHRERDVHVIASKRVIGCTTTGAAMYTESLRNIAPGVILVEEAGEILESHILAAMSPSTKQLVLIGDHKQLRPKIDNFDLSIEKGDGYDLNMSLFERLVLSGYPCTALTTQHRMRPEISKLVRQLTYPELKDDTKTQGRPRLRGVQNNIMFISHEHAEVNNDRIADRRDGNAKSSRENEYEADMVLKCVRYLGQQGYGTGQIVILTPYLGQLFLLRDKLKKDNDPVLNDLDSWDLIKAGLIDPGASGVAKRSIKISTIDNYQGEESDIVIASLTRSNDAREIGFMASPQRVNVLLSRARNALIMIGNVDTYLNNRKGRLVWKPLLEQLRQDGHIYHGFPVKCENHPDKKKVLSAPDDFDTYCPDGGCFERCNTMLSCGVHTCSQYCHLLQDHSKMACKEFVKASCPQGHSNRRRCHDVSTAVCQTCEEETRKKREREQRDFDLEQERKTKQRAYTNQLAELKAEIEHERRLMTSEAEAEERTKVLSQHRQDLEKAKDARRARRSAVPVSQSEKAIQNPSGEDDATAGAPPPQSEPQSPVHVVLPNSEKAGENGAKENDSWDQSDARNEWEYQKKYEGQENETLDKLIEMIGLESVKQKFLAIKTKVDTLVRQGVSLERERFGAVLLGNPGTGKTTVARLYAQFLCKVGALPGDQFVETSGSSLANGGVNNCKKHVDDILNGGGGVFFIDEAYQLVSGNNHGGTAVLDYLLPEIENLTGKVTFVLAGYRKQMEDFFAHNPGIPSRVPVGMTFEDYQDEELLKIMRHTIDEKYNGLMRVEGGMLGLEARILSRRIGKGRGREGFGNAREVQNRVAIIAERQAKRLNQERRTKSRPDDCLFTRADMLGPEPSVALTRIEAWVQLQNMIGLSSVKQSVQVLVDTLQSNYQKELEEEPIVEYSLNKCFIGSPGTGKTSVAKLYGRILAELGMLSNGEVVVKNPSDFVGDALGRSEAQTKAILASTIGKVLIIDEAYMLCTGPSSSADPYKSAVVDTIVAEIQSTPGEDRCVLLLGYKEQMENMLRDVNPGMARRFPLDSSFVFEDFNDEELEKILNLKLKQQGFSATSHSKQVAMEVLGRTRNKPNWGNAGEVDILLNKAKMNHQRNLTEGNSKLTNSLEPCDFDPDFDRGATAHINLQTLFRGVIGCENIIDQLQKYQTTVKNMRALKMDPRGRIPFTFLFTGPPGTGKTTTARRMGKVYYDMGLLSSTEVVECSATDMIAQFMGQTGPQVQKLLESALGKILIIDEAYRLAEGSYATEAINELVDSLTKPKYQNKLICILAGYEQKMSQLMSVNPGLTSRFRQKMQFRSLTAEECFQLLMEKLKAQDARVDVSAIAVDGHFRDQLLPKFDDLEALDSWGNARDIETLASDIFNEVLASPKSPITDLVVSEAVILEAVNAMLLNRQSQASDVASLRYGTQDLMIPCPQIAPDVIETPAQTRTTTHSASIAQVLALPKLADDNIGATDHAQASVVTDSRDDGVSDEIWQKLEQDKLEAERRSRDHECLEKQRLVQQQEESEARIELAQVQKAEQDAQDDEERRKLEADRIKRELDLRRHEELLRQIELERQRRKEEQERERQAQKKLREMGVCVAGFRWIKQASGYRCAGGVHFVSDQELGI